MPVGRQVGKYTSPKTIDKRKKNTTASAKY